MKRKGLLCMILALLLVLPGMRFVRAEEAGSAESKVAGYYVCFETENDTVNPVLRKGILTLQDGMIVQFTNGESSSQSIKIDKPTNIIVKHNFD